MKTTSSTRETKNRPWALWILSGITIALPVVLFVLAGISYCYSPDFIDRKQLTLGPLTFSSYEPLCLLALFFLPLLVQAVGMISLLRQGQQDKAVFKYHGLCLVTVCFASSGYCSLWLLYTWGFHAQFLSFVALAIVAVLTLIVGFVTYLIMRLPKPLVWHSPTLTEEDIRDKKERMCAKLCLAKGQNSHNYLTKVNGVLEKPGLDNDDGVGNMAAAVEKGEYETINLAAVVKRLNEGIIENKDFFKETDIEEIDGAPEGRRLWEELQRNKSELSARERRKQSRRANRLLLEACFDNEIISPLPRASAEQSPLEVRLGEFEAGLSKSPFGALMFFFTVFLGVSYLFGFAFAFDDRAHLTSGNPPSLFMARTRASSAIGEQAGIQTPAWPEYVFFYVDGDHTGFGKPRDYTFETLDSLLLKRKNLQADKERLDSGASESAVGAKRRLRGKLPKSDKDTERKLKDLETEFKIGISDWKKSRNYDHILRLANAIESESTAGREILLELKSGTPGVNTVWEEEMRRNIKYLLLERLSEKQPVPCKIDWLYLPSSNLPETTSPELREIADSAARGFSDEESLARLRGQSPALAKEVYRINDLRAHLSSDDMELLDRRLDQVQLAAQKSEQIQDKTATKDKLTDWATALREHRQLVEADDVSKEMNHEIMVSVRPIRNTHPPIPMSLMDYMYFTIYTITTTGYGDIVPTTTYAKFLCSIANILEVFFLVVFFNALLSAKKRRER